MKELILAVTATLYFGGCAVSPAEKLMGLASASCFGDDAGPSVDASVHVVIGDAHVITIPIGTTTQTYAKCADEYSYCGFSALTDPVTRTVRFGSPGHYSFVTTTAYGIQCDTSAFADPGGMNRTCEIEDAVTAIVDASVPAVVDAYVPPVAPPATGTAARPAASRGVGFFTIGSKLYDANGKEFRVRGLNRVHWDSWSPGIAATKANTQRWIVDFSRPAATNVALLGQDVTEHRVTAPGNWGGTCKSEAETFERMVTTLVDQAAAWNTLERYSLVNIANEWGPPAGNSTVWRDSYISAIGRMRAAGYHGTLMIDAPGCGQDPDAIPLHGAAVLAADPEHNLLFSQHIYGFYSDPMFPGQAWSQTTLVAQIARLKATGLPVILGEFGPGRNVDGGSPTTLDPVFVIQQAEGAGFGWLPWAWDDGPASGRDDTWFAMSKDGTYLSTSDLTTFGKATVEDPTWGLRALAKPASVF